MRTSSSRRTITTTSGSPRQIALGRRRAAGIRSFVVGTGGAPLRPFTRDPSPITRFRQDVAWGLLSLNLGAGGYDWQFVDADAGATLDAGTATCH